MITYHLLFNDGKRASIRALSAGRAMQMGLELRPGETIAECFSGNKIPVFIFSDDVPGSGYWAQPAWVDYEVPPHKPVLSYERKEEVEQNQAFAFLAEIPQTEKPTKKRVVKIKERTHA